jgi:hypothetical protein
MVSAACVHWGIFREGRLSFGSWRQLSHYVLEIYSSYEIISLLIPTGRWKEWGTLSSHSHVKTCLTGRNDWGNIVTIEMKVMKNGMRRGRKPGGMRWDIRNIVVYLSQRIDRSGSAVR